VTDLASGFSALQDINIMCFTDQATSVLNSAVFKNLFKECSSTDYKEVQAECFSLWQSK